MAQPDPVQSIADDLRPQDALHHLLDPVTDAIEAGGTLQPVENRRTHGRPLPRNAPANRAMARELVFPAPGWETQGVRRTAGRGLDLSTTRRAGAPAAGLAGPDRVGARAGRARLPA